MKRGEVMDVQQEFVQLCLQTMGKEDYGDRQKRLRHNRAVTKLEKLKKQLGREDAAKLLDHGDPRVRIYTASACLEQGFLKKEAAAALRLAAKTEKDPTLKFSASMLLKQCMED